MNYTIVLIVLVKIVMCGPRVVEVLVKRRLERCHPPQNMLHLSDGALKVSQVIQLK